MNNKILIPLLAALLFVAAPEAKAQDNLCEAMGAYNSLEYASFDKKGKKQGSFTYHMEDVSKSGDATELLMKMTFTDEKGKAADHEMEVTYICEGSTVTVDMASMITPEMTKAFGESMELEVEADEIEYPSSVSVGQSLDGGEVTVTAVNDEGGTFGTMKLAVSDRSVDSEETVEVKGGSFDAYVITERSAVELRIGRLKVPGMGRAGGNSKIWYAPKAGIWVKSEVYSKKGKSRGSTELIAIN